MYEIEKLQAAIGIFFCNRDNQAQVGFHHFLFRAAGSCLAQRHAPIDVFYLRQAEADIHFCDRDFLLRTDDITAHGAEFFRRGGLVGLDDFVDPLNIGLFANKRFDKFLAWNLCAVDTEAHDSPLLLSHAIQRTARRGDHGVEYARCQLEKFEQFAELVEILFC